MRRSRLVALAPVVLAAVVSACAAPPATVSLPASEPAFPVWVVSHGWHTGLVVRRDDIPESLWPEASQFPQADHVEVGWGDRYYYPDPDPGFGMLLKAAFGASPSVIHTVGLRGPPEAQFPDSEVIRLALPRDGFQRLVRYVHDTYAREDGRPAPRLAPGLYGDSGFYPAVGSFHALRNCNVWTLGALRAAGLPVIERVTTRGVMSQVRPLGTVVARGTSGKKPAP